MIGPGKNGLEYGAQAAQSSPFVLMPEQSNTSRSYVKTPTAVVTTLTPKSLERQKTPASLSHVLGR